VSATARTLQQLRAVLSYCVNASILQASCHNCGRGTNPHVMPHATRCTVNAEQLLGLVKKRESLMALVAAGWRSLGQSHGRVTITFAQPLSLKQELAAARAATAAAGATGECVAVAATMLTFILRLLIAAMSLVPSEHCDMAQMLGTLHTNCGHTWICCHDIYVRLSFSTHLEN
jgi:Glycerol-3-phosphate acyltransferase C-terminal region